MGDKTYKAVVTRVKDQIKAWPSWKKEFRVTKYSSQSDATTRESVKTSKKTQRTHS